MAKEIPNFMVIRKGKQRFPKNTNIIQAFQESVLNKGWKDVAKAIGKSATKHFYAEMNPNTDQLKAKIGLDDAIEATTVTKNYVWLEMLVVKFGFHMVPADIAPNRETVADELNDDLEHLSEFCRVCRDPESTEIQIRAASHALRQDIRQTEKLAVQERQKKKNILFGETSTSIKQ